MERAEREARVSPGIKVPPGVPEGVNVAGEGAGAGTGPAGVEGLELEVPEPEV